MPRVYSNMRGEFPRKLKPATVQRIHILRTAKSFPDALKTFPKAKRSRRPDSKSSGHSFRTYTDGQCIVARRGTSNLERFC